MDVQDSSTFLGNAARPPGAEPLRDVGLVPLVMKMSGPLATLVLSTVAMAQALQLWRWRPGTPLGELGDAPYMAALVRGYVEYGPYADNPLFGAPYILNAGWASTVDDLHIWIMTVFGLFGSDPLTVMSLYFFLTFPLAALTMYWLCRQYSASRPAAVVAGVLFAVIPGQQERFPHLFLAAYWAVPFAVWVLLETAQGRGVLHPGAIRGGVRGKPVWRSRLAVIGMLLAIGLGDIYYVAFTLVVAVPLIFLRQLRRRNLGEAGRLALPLGVMVLPALLSLAYARSRAARDEVSGGMAFGRSVADSDRWSGRLMDLILPWEGHRLPLLSYLSQAYDVLTDTHGEVSALGIVPLAGVVGLCLVAASAALRRGWGALSTVGAAMSVVLLLCLAFYIKGGLGSWVALFVTPQIRTWSRIFLFVAALGLLAVALWLGAVYRRRGRWVGGALFAMLLLGGVWDQTNPSRAPNYSALGSRHADLAQFSRTVSATLGSGCAIFNLPVVQFPEVDHPSVADNFSLGIASEGLRWSFGAIKGTTNADWQLGLSTSDVDTLVDDLAAVGFCGVAVHRSLPVAAPEIAQGLPSALGPPIAQTPDGLFTAFDLRQRRAQLVSSSGASAVAERTAAVLAPVVVSVSGTREIHGGERTRLALGPRPSLRVRNMSDHALNLSIAVTVASPAEISRAFQISGLGQKSQTALVTGQQDATLSISVQVPPGQSTLEIETPGSEIDLSMYDEWEMLPYIAEVTSVSPDEGVRVGVVWPLS